MSLSKEELLLRALDTTKMLDFTHEDLSDLITLITPTDAPLFSRLARGKATNLLHEWAETELTGSFTAGKYADGSIPADHDNTHTRRNNVIMSVGRVAKATNLVRSLNLVGQADALAKELEEKMKDVIRVIEYYIFNGDRDITNPQEMDGLLCLLTAPQGANVIENAAAPAAIAESKLQAAITACYEKGGVPDIILARPSVAYAIANFTASKIQYPTGGAAGGVGTQAMRYLSPFGKIMEVIPVRSDFLPSGNVLVMESDHMELDFASNLIEIIPVPVAADAEARLIKAYLTLSVRALQHHAKISNVLD